MSTQRSLLVSALFFLAAWPSGGPCPGMDIVRDGRPVATIVVVGEPESPGPAGGKRTASAGDAQAAAVLVEWIRKMTDAELPVSKLSPKGPAIYVGEAAVKAGLTIDDLQSPSREGLRIRRHGDRLLLAGQSPTATTKAVCRLLEHWGCRYFIDHPLGEVYPRTKTLTVENLDLAEQPGFVFRTIWGSQWSQASLWKTWNGAGGIGMSAGHAWGRYVPREAFEKHPEYFALRDGQRRPGDWYCTSNPGLRQVFAENVLKQIAAGDANP